MLQVQTDEYGFVLEPMVMTIAGSAEFSGIKLRRSEKKPLNAINKGSNVEGGKAHAVRFCVPDPHKPQKTKERIGNGPEKIFIMVIAILSENCLPCS